MSDNQDPKSPVTDSQETYYEKSQNIIDSQVLNESQDFALIIGDDSDENTKNQSEAVENIDDNQSQVYPPEQNVDEAEAQIVINEGSNTCEISSEMQHVLTTVDKTKKHDVIESSNIKDYVEDRVSRERRGSEDDEIIQGTPPEISSPTRKLLSSKRRGESIDEPPSKIQKTLSEEDALKLDKENLVARAEKASMNFKLILSNPEVDNKSESDILCENTEHFDKNEELDICSTQSHPRVIIAETQDSEDSEPIVSGTMSHDDNVTPEDEPEEFGKERDSGSGRRESQLDVITSTPENNEKEDPAPSKDIVSKTCKNALEATTNGKHNDEVNVEIKTNEVVHDKETDSTDEKKANVVKSIEEKDCTGPIADKEFLNVKLPSSDSASDSNYEVDSNNSNKSRKSIEVIYDGKSMSQEKKKCTEMVTIDEDGEAIVLDSSTEELHLQFSTSSSHNSPQNTTLYKSCVDSKSNSESSYRSTAWNEACIRNDTIETSDCQLTNGDDDRNMSGTTKTVSSGSDQLVDDLLPDTLKIGTSKFIANDSDVDERFNLSSKLSETMEAANIISDSEKDGLSINGNVQNKFSDKATVVSNTSAAGKTTVYENKIRLQIELKYLVHIDENSREILYKEVTDVQCDPLVENLGARRNSDASGCLADVSGNAYKDSSPGSVSSNPQLFQLPMSRFSIASTISSSSSISSAASLATKLLRDVNFPLPKGRAKHAKKPTIETVLEEKLNSNESFERITQGWKNSHLIIDTVLQSANMVINSPEIFQHDNERDKNEDKVLASTPEPSSTEEKILSSTPEPVTEKKVTSQLATPKSTKDKKPLRRSRTKNSSKARNSSKRKISPEVITSQEDRVPIGKRKRENTEMISSNKLLKETATVSTPIKQRPGTPSIEALRSLTPQNLSSEDLVGKVVFAKWSDNNYYPGEVTERTKGKLRVKFYDGKVKLLIDEFVIPMPHLLREGLSVYATTKDDDYGSMGIIVQSENVNNVIYYTVEMDNGKRVKVETKDIFLMPGQAQILKEEVDIDSKSLPKTPQHLSEVSLDNLVDWKRRQPGTPTVSTPKSRKGTLPRASRTPNSMQASGSGIPKNKEILKETSSSESDARTSNSNISSIEDVDGVQPELVTVPTAQISKGPATRVKGRARSKSKPTQDDEDLGPIPPPSSSIFKNMSFILTSTSSDIISHHHTDDSYSEAGTENEEEWLRPPFSKDWVKRQLISGGGTVYDSFNLIPPNEYKNTKLITNAPNLTAKSIQCLSAGISIYNHKWVIHCCRENKTLIPSRYELPAGWSLEKNMYIESYNRINKQPFNGMIIGMPMLDNGNTSNRSIAFWRRICENAGAGIQMISDPEANFSNTTAILTDNGCPSWLVEKADIYQIPLVSTVWIIQCIIAGQSLLPDALPQYKHTFIQS